MSTIEGEAVDVEKEKKNMSLGEFFFKCMRKRKESIAQYNADNGFKETYGDLLKRSIRTGLRLQETGVTQNDIISLYSLNTENSFVPFIAAQLIGAKVSTFHPYFSRKDTVYLLKLVEPKVVFVSMDEVELIEECSREAGIETRLIVFGRSEKFEDFSEYMKPQEGEEEFKPVPKDVKETAAIMFSSGTTGYPKGVCVSHSALVSHYFPNDPDTWCPVILGYTTLYWISGVINLIKAVSWGAAQIICSRYDPAQTWNIIEKYKVNYLFLPAFNIRDFIEAKPKNYDISSLQLVVSAADKVTYEILEGLLSVLPDTTRLLNYYSLTELGGCSLNQESIEYDDVKKRSTKAISCGKVPPNWDWKLVDPSTEETLGPNQNGELRVKTEHMTDGYYKMNSASLLFDGDGYLKTGDLFSYDEDGFLYSLGRLKDVFKYRGWHVSPVVIEDILMSHPAIEDALVIDVPHELDGNHPMGVVKLKKQHKHVKPEDIQSFAEEKLSDHEQLRAGVKIVEDIPYTVTGKKRRHILRERIVGRVAA